MSLLKYHDTDHDGFHLKPVEVQSPGFFETLITFLGYAAVIAGVIWLLS